LRRIFIGDVQGCADELEELLERLQVDPQNDRLHFVGDLVRRGPKSLEVLRLVRDLDAICVLGNHEAFLLRTGFFTRSSGGAEGVAAELVSLFEAPDLEELGAFVASMPLLHATEDLCLVHAAMPPALWPPRSLAEGQALLPAWQDFRFTDGIGEEQSFLLHTRYCDPQGRTPAKDHPKPGPPFQPWFRFYRGPWTVVYGHWARKGLVLQDRLRGLDTGCVYGRKLSAWIAEDDSIVQVSARRRYSH